MTDDALDLELDVGAARPADPSATAWREVLDVFVAGRPAPQGSKTARPIYRGTGPDRQFTGKVAQVESSKTGVATWRADVRAAVETAWACPGRCSRCPQLSQPHTRPPLDGAVRLVVEFVMPRPTSTPKRTTPPAVKRPDLGKLARSTEDALTTAGLYRDDSLIVDEHLTKRLAQLDETPGARIRVQVPA